jgi:hypothetical protein
MQNIRLQYTTWEEMSEEVQSLFDLWMDNRVGAGQTFYELYFYWFNIAHELAHILRAHYGSQTDSHWKEETSVNDFAVAYWKKRGETKRLYRLRELVNVVFAKLEDPVPTGENRLDYFDNHYRELSTNALAYAHYQFSMVLSALEKQLDFSLALRTLITPQAYEVISLPAATYSVIDADLPPRIVSDMRVYLAPYGVDLPELRINRSFSPMIQFVDWD